MAPSATAWHLREYAASKACIPFQGQIALAAQQTGSSHPHPHHTVVRDIWVLTIFQLPLRLHPSRGPKRTSCREPSRLRSHR
jgi:hypothetical protein